MTPPPTHPEIGIIGLGNIGRYHAERLQSLDVTLAGGMDINATARDQFSRQYGTDVYEDHRDLLAVADALIVTTPNKYHEQYAVDALEHHCHVLIEKPLAHTLESANRIVQAATESDAICMVGFNNRFANTVKIVKNRIDEGELGRITHVEANYVRRRGIPGRGSWFTRRETSGGGALIDLGVHAIDLALHLLDYPPLEEVTGVARSAFGSRNEYAYLEMWGEDGETQNFDVDDSASAFVRCRDNQSIALEVAWATNRPATHEFIVRGTDAAARFDLLENELSIHSASTAGVDHLEDTSIQTIQNDTHRDELKTFIDALDSPVDYDDSVEKALAVQRVVDAIYRSSENRQTIRIDS